MTALSFPYTIFKTKNKMDDYGANDMRYGDLSATELTGRFGLSKISSQVDPYKLQEMPLFSDPASRFHGSMSSKPGKAISKQKCADILFNEFYARSLSFSFWGGYRHLIREMIRHMQHGNGTPFRNHSLNAALRDYILSDYPDQENSTRYLIRKALANGIDWKNNIYLADKRQELTKAIYKGRLPKFTRFQDNFNGLGIAVHDIWAMHITIKSLAINNNRFRAIVHYKGQDHFGLDDKDILNPKYREY